MVPAVRTFVSDRDYKVPVHNRVYANEQGGVARAGLGVGPRLALVLFADPLEEVEPARARRYGIAVTRRPAHHSPRRRIVGVVLQGIGNTTRDPGRFARNVCVGLGNWGSEDAVPVLRSALADADPLVRSHAAWALGSIGPASAATALRSRLRDEPGPEVRMELEQALSSLPDSATRHIP